MTTALSIFAALSVLILIGSWNSKNSDREFSDVMFVVGFALLLPTIGFAVGAYFF